MHYLAECFSYENFSTIHLVLSCQFDRDFFKKAETYSLRPHCFLSRLEKIENKYRNASPAQKHYPAHLPPFLSPHRQNYSHPFGISMYDAPSPPIPTSFRLHARVRRRSENKKCRKVYGIENRDIWCTQCKWKKACTRFTSTDKDDGPGLMYITDYEGMPYPV